MGKHHLTAIDRNCPGVVLMRKRKTKTHVGHSFAIAQSADLWSGFSVIPYRGSLSLGQVFFRLKVAIGSLSTCFSISYLRASCCLRQESGRMKVGYSFLTPAWKPSYQELPEMGVWTASSPCLLLTVAISALASLKCLVLNLAFIWRKNNSLVF